MNSPNRTNSRTLERVAESSFAFGMGYLILSDRSLPWSNVIASLLIGVGLAGSIASEIRRRKQFKAITNANAGI